MFAKEVFVTFLIIIIIDIQMQSIRISPNNIFDKNKTHLNKRIFFISNVLIANCFQFLPLNDLNALAVSETIITKPSPINDKELCITESNPSVTTQFCRKIGLVKGRLRGCQANENCFSTSAKAADKYSPPWTYNLGQVDNKNGLDNAWIILNDAIKLEGLKILQSDTKSHYILAAEKNVPKQPTGASLFYEFLIKDDFILYRAFVDKTIFVYPLQQPVSDFGALESKLNAILNRTGWLKVSQ